MKTSDVNNNLETQCIVICDPVSIIIRVRYCGDKAVVVDQHIASGIARLLERVRAICKQAQPIGFACSGFIPRV